MIKEGAIVRRTSRLRLLNGKPFDQVEKVFKIVPRNNPTKVSYSVSFPNSQTLVKMQDLIEIDAEEQAIRKEMYDSIKYVQEANFDLSACTSQKSGQPKLAYRNEYDAMCSAFAMSIRDGKTSGWMVYTCGHCGQVHIGNYDPTLKLEVK